MAEVVDLVSHRKIKALDANIKELVEVTTAIKSAMQGLSKYTHYSSVRNRVNDLFVLYKEVKSTKEKKQEILQRLKYEQELDR
jgi:hypothetical protein